MNNKSAQNDLAMMIQKSLALRLCELGANEDAVEAHLQTLDFDAVRSHMPNSNDELKAAFSHLFA